MLDDLDVHGLVKPLLRGRLHVGAFVVAVPAAIALVLAADGRRATLASLVYGASLVGLFGISGAYHRLGRTDRRRAILRRADHATIYGLIAGTYTPVAIVAIRGRMGWSLAIAMWVAAGIGMALKLLWFDRTRKVGAAMYIALGWVAVFAGPALIDNVHGVGLVLIAVGGLLYTGGAVVLARRRPDPVPHVFGYHEVWHTFVIVAAACHFLAIWGIVT
jgi:hemolysin III